MEGFCFPSKLAIFTNIVSPHTNFYFTLRIPSTDMAAHNVYRPGAIQASFETGSFCVALTDLAKLRLAQLILSLHPAWGWKAFAITPSSTAGS